MKIINAVWEKKNLGVNTLEIEFDKKEVIENKEKIIENINANIAKYDAEYIVIKVPSGRFDILNVVQDCGYRFIESQIILKGTKKEVEIKLKKIKKLMPDYSNASYYKVDSKMKITEIMDRIKEGIFDTDRIALDSRFGKKIANIRYANWVLDNFNEGKSIYVSKYEDEEIGFFNDNLLGMYVEYKDKGIGMYNVLNAYTNAIENYETNVLKAVVSSNNLSIVKLYGCLDIKIDTIKYVLINHI